MVLLLVMCRGEAPGQFFSNPSFEGPPGISLPPPSWQSFDPHSTPDTDPVACDRFLASDGETYLTLVTRGEGDDPGTFETITTILLNSLEPGKYYRLSVDLASREEVGHFTWEEGFLSYQAPVFLRIYASPGNQDKGELLAESDVITDRDWTHHEFFLIPNFTCSTLSLEVAPANGSPGWGNLALDRLEMEEIDELPLDMGELVIPNVFTPNGDGFNDVLVISGLRSGSSLIIYDRTGNEVFISDHYEQDWDGRNKEGRDVPPGTYWYILSPSNTEEVFKGFIYLKREQ
jgi:gliding motility-associated-like protein